MSQEYKSVGHKLLDLAMSGNTTGFIDEFKYELATRIEPKLDQKRHDVSGHIFTAPIKTEDE